MIAGRVGEVMVAGVIWRWRRGGVVMAGVRR